MALGPIGSNTGSLQSNSTVPVPPKQQETGSQDPKVVGSSRNDQVTADATNEAQDTTQKALFESEITQLQNQQQQQVVFDVVQQIESQSVYGPPGTRREGENVPL